MEIQIQKDEQTPTHRRMLLTTHTCELTLAETYDATKVVAWEQESPERCDHWDAKKRE